MVYGAGLPEAAGAEPGNGRRPGRAPGFHRGVGGCECFHEEAPEIPAAGTGGADYDPFGAYLLAGAHPPERAQAQHCL